MAVPAVGAASVAGKVEVQGASAGELHPPAVVTLAET